MATVLRQSQNALALWTLQHTLLTTFNLDDCEILLSSLCKHHEYRHVQPYLAFYTGAVDLNSGTQAYESCLSPTEPSSQPKSYFPTCVCVHMGSLFSASLSEWLSNF